MGTTELRLLTPKGVENMKRFKYRGVDEEQEVEEGAHRGCAMGKRSEEEKEAAPKYRRRCVSVSTRSAIRAGGLAARRSGCTGSNGGCRWRYSRGTSPGWLRGWDKPLTFSSFPPFLFMYFLYYHYFFLLRRCMRVASIVRPCVCVRSRAPTSREQKSLELQDMLQGAMQHVVGLVNERKDHIPPVVSAAGLFLFVLFSFPSIPPTPVPGSFARRRCLPASTEVIHMVSAVVAKELPKS